jgi:carboxyl-terminal processing protease
VDTEQAEFRVDNIQGPWDVAARLREVFVFLQKNLKDTGVDLREVEYAACNGMLKTLDPHSTFMSPEAYKDMNLTTSGHFGGLGIVISIRDQMLTIMRPIPGTPAGRAGLRRYDRITKINNESTLNMPLDDAVDRLRGEPNTKVTVWVHRDAHDGVEGWAGSRPFELNRETIKIESVDSRALGNGVAYVRIKQFQSSTDDELERALAKLSEKGAIRALVFDLRNNPGGLLDQATRVADRFVQDGVLVSTVGNADGRDEKRASREGTEPQYPIVVLLNGQSASASEIVAGALKNLNRAVVVGQTSFGKGSVQLVFPKITRDGAALKLTIAQYLTPGNVSIQGVGVTPDIELDPMTADLVEMDLFGTDHPLRERDLSKSLASADSAKKSSEPPFSRLRYNLPEKEREQLRELGGEVDDEYRLDFPIAFARDLAAKMPVAARRLDQLTASKAFLEQVQSKEMASIAGDLSKLGVDWSVPAKDAEVPKAGEFQVKVETDRKDDSAIAGEAMTLKVTVKNNGKVPAYQLRAITKSDGPYYDEKELVFGRIDPGETKTASAPLGWCEIEGHKAGSTKPVDRDAKRVCTLPKDAVARQDVVKVRFSCEGGQAPPDAELRPTVTNLPRPSFAYAYQIVDNRPGNGDGQLDRGEGATLYLTVKNVGKGRSYETQANIRNLTGDGLYLHAGRFDISNMAPGEVREVAFTFDVLDTLGEELAKVELSVTDRDVKAFATEKIVLPIAAKKLSIQPQSGRVRLNADAGVRGQPIGSARVVGELSKGSVVERLGTLDEYTKVRLGGERFGFVATRELADAGPAAARPKFRPQLTRSPPLLDVIPAGLATRDTKVHIEGKATDPDGVQDAYVFVGGRKVFYQSNKKAADRNQLKFSFDVQLDPGMNVINVLARESEDTATRTTMVIRRDGAAGESLPTPKQDMFGEDWQFGDGED